MSIDGSSATVSGTTLSFVAAAAASGRATGANAAAVVARAANTAAFIFFACAGDKVLAHKASPAMRGNARFCRYVRLRDGSGLP